MSYPLSLPADGPLITLTNPKPSLWIIELHNGKDSRLTDVLIDRGVKPALDVVEKHWRERWREAQKSKGKKDHRGHGALIIVGNRSQDKFFSNGLDFEKATKHPNFFGDIFNPMLARLLTFPIPTIAAINGHAFAAGMMLSLACDYRVMADGSKRNAWLCMNEVHFGAIWPLSFAAILRAKVGDGHLQRKIALEGSRITSSEALKAGIVDHIVSGGTEDVISMAVKLADSVGSFAQGGVWGLIKTDLYRDTLESVHHPWIGMSAVVADDAAKARL